MENEVNVTGYDESSHMSFLEGSGADLLTNVSNTPLCSENEADKSNLRENLRFDSDDSVLDSDYEDSTSANNGNSGNLDDGELLNEAPTTSQRAYSRKESCTRRNLGKAYVNVKGVVVSERKLIPLIINCRMKCESKESDDILLRDLEKELLAHQSKADFAYESKRNDKTCASDDPKVKVYTFDLQ
ncbi:uncharacterized protein LOC128870126 [Anastrepha ludens]|uniref:uncharacterized protein LOC128870126 n=1 Tax=Anastrepha ludens TaxID=28586 RepID=UPI0023B00A5C|nr:uncharacterized protein LOC128870126 [Anastrepha ludens]